MMKQVLGISFGRKMRNSDVMVKAALLECKAAGFEIEFLRADDLNIHNCTGCIACSIGLMSGQAKGECAHKDDMPILDEAVLRSDAVILGCPVYETSPTGRFKTICDRIGPSHDLSFRKVAIEEGLAAGKSMETLPDSRCLKPRVGALMSVGGAMTKNWLAFSIPIMYQFTFPLAIDVIDHFECHGAMAYEHIVGNDEAMARCAQIGRNIAGALNAESEADRTRWRGDLQGVCPMCHCNLLTIPENGDATKIECPVCGIAGVLTIKDGIIQAHFSDEEMAHSRLSYAGLLEHSTEIKTRAAPSGSIPDLKERLEKYRWLNFKES